MLLVECEGVGVAVTLAEGELDDGGVDGDDDDSDSGLFGCPTIRGAS